MRLIFAHIIFYNNMAEFGMIELRHFLKEIHLSCKYPFIGLENNIDLK